MKTKSHRIWVVFTMTLIASMIKGDIPNCMIYEPDSQKNICSQCEDGFFLKRKLDDTRTNFTTTCPPCSPHCKTCIDVEKCLSCSNFRNLKNVTIFFVPTQTCLFKLEYSAGIFVGLITIAILVYITMYYCFCSKVKDIEKLFLSHEGGGNNYVNVGQLMQNPQQYNAGAGPQNVGNHYGQQQNQQQIPNVGGGVGQVGAPGTQEKAKEE